MYHITFRVYGKCDHETVNFSIRIADIRHGSETPYVLLYINYSVTKFPIFIRVLAWHILTFVCGDQRSYCSVMRGVNRFMKFLYSEALDDPRTDVLYEIIHRVETAVM